VSKYNIPWGGFAIAEKDWNFIRDIIRGKGIKTVLEFGTGLSTLLISEIAEVDTFETDAGWQKRIKAKIPSGRKVGFYIWNGCGPPGTEWKRKKYNLAFVDGPRGKASGGTGRETSIKMATKYADKIIVHDAGRADEAELQEQRIRCNYWERK